MALKIEPGKFYKTRDGRKVRIYTVDGALNEPIHGAILYGHGWQSNSWARSDGRWSLCLGTGRTDIVAEWEEPKPRRKAYVDKHGGVWLSHRDMDKKFYSRCEWLDEPEE